MEFKGRKRSSNTNTISKKEEYIDVEVNQYILDIMCRFVLSDNRNIRRTQLNNLKLFVNIINPANYRDNPEIVKRIDFIRKGIDARITYGLTDKVMILSHIKGGMLDDNEINSYQYDELSNSEVNWISDVVSETIRYSCIYNYVDTIMEACVDFKTAELGNKKEAVENFERVISSVQNNLRKRRNEAASDASFTLKDGAFEEIVHETYNEFANPRRKLITGMQGLNDMLGGGFESTRCYVFFGLPGEGKSTILLNLAYQLKKYNRGFKTIDPTKRPCIVLLTMENFIDESIERLFSIATGKDQMINYSVEDVIKMMKEEGGLHITDDDPIDIIIKFKPSNSCDTSYLYTLYEDLQDEGLECICLIQDYLGRIRSTERFPDTRLEYGAVSDEFKKFAEVKSLVVISASQLNRDASKHVDEAKQKGKTDLVKLFGRSNISESMLILNNIDAGFMIAPEHTRTGEKYLGIQDIKHRYRTNGTILIYLPFVGSSMKLKEDFYTTPCFKTTMREDNGNTMNISGASISPYHTNFPGNTSNYNPETNITHGTGMNSSVFSGVVYRQQDMYKQPSKPKMRIKPIEPIVYDLIDPIKYD